MPEQAGGGVLVFLLPRVHAQGLKQSVCLSVVVVVIVVVVIVGTKIARSRVLGICVCYKHNQLVYRYRWKTGLYALRIAQKGLLVLQIVYFLFSMPGVYRPHPLPRQVLIRLRMLKLNVGKGHQVIKQLWSSVLQYYATVATKRAGYVFFRALVWG